MDIAHNRHESEVVTKREKSIAKLGSYDETSAKIFGCLQGSATIEGDLIDPIDIDWKVMEL